MVDNNNRVKNEGISVVRKVGMLGKGGYGMRAGMTEHLEGSQNRVLQQAIRYFEESLHPKPTLLLNVADMLIVLAMSGTTTYFILMLITQTQMWALGLVLLVSIWGMGAFFSLLAYRNMPYARSWIAIRLFFTVLGVCVLYV